MTNVSNYGPVRRLSPPVSADSRKPYSRTGLKGVLGTLDLNSGDAVVPPTLDSPYYPFHVEIPQLEAPSQSRFTVPEGSRDIPGFPTYDQYQRIEEEYLTSLSERKQPKALISQSLFDKIYAVLQNGSEDRASTAQFRFWVRKMFVLAYPQTSFNHNTSQTPEPVVLHDKRPVAIKERLYEVLCYCHAVARHGGRDKTCATLRINYSWVPKELTAKFVKACPTCTLKRSGNPDLLSQFNYVPQSYLPTAPEPALLNGGPNDSSSGLNFVGSSVCDNNSASAASSGTSAAGFAPSIFATPDLSVYPSPTLSSGSGGPMTPSPYLHGGLFGYPVVFDPGHNSLHPVAGWEPSPSPCVPGYDCGGSGEPLLRESTKPASADDEHIDTHQLRLPTPKKVVRLPRCYDHSGSGGFGYNARFEQLPPPPPPPSRVGIKSSSSGTPPPPCVLDTNIDPALFMEGGGFPTPGPPARRTTLTGTDTDMAPAPPSTPWDTPTMSAYGAAPGFCLLLHLPGPGSSPAAPCSRSGTCCTTASTPPRALVHLSPSGGSAGPGGMVFAPVPVPAPAAMGVGRMTSVLCGMETETEMEMEMAAGAEPEPDPEGGAEPEVKMEMEMCGQERWESPEAWLVPSDSAEETDGYHD